jgi:hypothetical protein
MHERITEAELRGLEEMASNPDARIPGTGLSGERIAQEFRRLRGLILRVGKVGPSESLAALAARYGVDRAREWSEVFDEAEAIRKEQGA